VSKQDNGMRSQLAWFDQLRRWWVVAGRGLAECSMVDFLKHRVAKAPLMKLIARTLMKWQQDECLEMGAALAYYAVFSLFPMILVSLSIVGFLIGPNTVAFNTIISVARDALPPDAFQIVQTTLIQFHAGSTSASIIGFVILLFTASGFFWCSQWLL
jgi:membrane protein